MESGPDATQEHPGDAGNDAPVDTGAPHDAGPVPDAALWDGATITCDQGPCRADTQVCCNTNRYDSVDGSSCTTAAACTSPALKFGCSSASDCAAQGHSGWFCCSNLQPTGLPDGAVTLIVNGATCAPTCGGSLYSPVVLCDPADPLSADQCAKMSDSGDTSCLPINAPIFPSGYYCCGGG
jgi:hypothetical protein